MKLRGDWQHPGEWVSVFLGSLDLLFKGCRILLLYNIWDSQREFKQMINSHKIRINRTEMQDNAKEHSSNIFGSQLVQSVLNI